MPFDLTIIILILYKFIVIVTRHKLTILIHDCNIVITQCYNNYNCDNSFKDKNIVTAKDVQGC